MPICRETKKWVEEQVEQPMERWVETTQRRCKKYKWYDPRGWFCWLVTIVVKVVQIVVVTVGKWVAHVVCIVVTNLANAAAYIAGLALSIPFIGPLIRFIARLGLEIASSVLGIFDRIGWWLGIRPRKNLRVCIIILRANRRHVINPAQLTDAIAWADNAFYSQAKIRVVITDIVQIHDDAPNANLDVGTDAGAVWDELWVAGSWFEAAANGYCFNQAFSRGVGLGAPVIAFVVRSVAGQATGCGLWFTDYITLERGLFEGNTADPTVFAHELGHACQLSHTDAFPWFVGGGRENLMFPNSSPMDPATGQVTTANLRGGNLTATQIHLLRSSRHVTYL
jgi:hypothetical protein